MFKSYLESIDGDFFVYFVWIYYTPVPTDEGLMLGD